MWTVGAIAAVLALVIVIVMCAAAVVDRHRAEAAADLAALAAAAAVNGGAGGATLGCRHAAEIATRMAAHLHSCTVRGVDALVIVSTRSDGVLLGLGAAEGRARAGPVLLTAPATH